MYRRPQGGATIALIKKNNHSPALTQLNIQANQLLDRRPPGGATITLIKKNRPEGGVT